MARLRQLAAFDMQGRLVCTVCGTKMPIPHDRALTIGEGTCPNGHQFWVDDYVACGIKDILKKQNAHREVYGRMLKNFEETPPFMIEKVEKGKILLP